MLYHFIIFYQKPKASPLFLNDWIEAKSVNKREQSPRQTQTTGQLNPISTIKLDRLDNLGDQTPPVQLKKDNAPENIGNVKVKTSPRIKGKFSPGEISARLRLFEQSKNKIVGLAPVLDETPDRPALAEKVDTSECNFIPGLID